MRVATIVVVLIIHVGFFILFAAQRRYLRHDGQEEAPSMAFFLPPDEVHTITEAAPQSPIAAQAARRTKPKRPAAAAAESPGPTVRPEQPSKTSSAAPTAPDWRSDMQIAANNEVEAEERRRHKPSLLAPHDFSGVRAGSTDYSKRQFPWDHAATHRVEELPAGGLLINLNDRCSIVWVIVPVAFCRIGKIRSTGDLFQLDAAALGKP
jgi:hypothetical protein